jgi:hypothetical protein
VTVTIPLEAVAETPTLAPLRLIASRRLFASAVVVLLPTWKFVPVFSVELAVNVIELTPFVIVTVPAGVPPVLNVPIVLAVTDWTAIPVVKTTKSFVQSGGAFMSNVYFAGNISSPTVPPAPSDIPQSGCNELVACGGR